ncbi:acyl-CoA thioesterase-1 [Breoghania corrubedonensis]|uniref:Acyl-CoA thioesterase-1 n=1 Tax=Breoghania corrubedonensis TaxID=665038 RepID=A0A2T5V5T5_9HYPH|nr:arylesterase [Breoghania corrubedonensis]PTW59086.1 acyl-CoA thioesterase-1 [Breoghania corrubedonensis]
MRFLALMISSLLVTCGLAIPQAGARQITIVALGDSLTAGYGLDPGEGFPDQLQRALKAKGHDVNVIDAGVSGDTTSGGLARLDWSVGEKADAVILELGANDALRGVAPEETRKNLSAMLEKLKARGLPVLLAGMLAPPNMGPEYGRAFNTIYPDLARKYGVRLYPFFLDGVAGDPALNLGDGMHPTEAGVAVIVKRILPDVEALLADASTAKKGD